MVGMSEQTASFAVDSMIATDMSDDEFGWEMFALAQAVGFDYERWCRVMGLDPDNPAIMERWVDLTWRWADTWKELGTDAFGSMVDDRVEKWERLLDRKTRIRL